MREYYFINPLLIRLALSNRIWLWAYKKANEEEKENKLDFLN